ncbi:hypothetical protein [Methylorubrum thiocyanatum]|uniref:hypothetical protein n=1 Tax=Methylorubrum thiocyanatum TaxID=47958 RepID=UPI0035C7EBA8
MMTAEQRTRVGSDDEADRPSQDESPRFFVAMAPTVAASSPTPQASQDRAARLIEGLWPARFSMAPIAAAHHATESCLMPEKIASAKRCTTRGALPVARGVTRLSDPGGAN